MTPRHTRVSLYGHLDDGRAVHRHVLGGDGLQADILDYGAILARLRFPGRQGPTDLVLGLDSLAAYVADTMFLGIVAGRFANRIAQARCTVDGRTLELTANEGPHHLHGGRQGLGKRLWQVAGFDDRRLRLNYRSPAGEEGYPGQADIEADFEVGADHLILTLRARVDAPCPINLTHHPYFNLAGAADVPAAAQRLWIAADRYLEVDSALIPTGRMPGVAGTALDFRVARTVGIPAPSDPAITPVGGYDHCLVLSPQDATLAELSSAHSGIRMRIEGQAPALQLYGGQAIPAVHPGIGDGLCLEPQRYPDAPNHADFGDTILRPGQYHENRIVYHFARD